MSKKSSEIGFRLRLWVTENDVPMMNIHTLAGTFDSLRDFSAYDVLVFFNMWSNNVSHKISRFKDGYSARETNFDLS